MQGVTTGLLASSQCPTVYRPEAVDGTAILVSELISPDQIKRIAANSHIDQPANIRNNSAPRGDWTPYIGRFFSFFLAFRIKPRNVASRRCNVGAPIFRAILCCDRPSILSHKSRSSSRYLTRSIPRIIRTLSRIGRTVDGRSSGSRTTGISTTLCFARVAW